MSVSTIDGFCVCFMFCYVLLCVLFSFTIILMGKGELVALLLVFLVSYECYCSVAISHSAVC